MFDRIRIRSGQFILIVAIFTYLSTFIAAFQVTLLDTTKTDSLEWVTHSIGNNNGRIGWREASFTYKQGDVVRVYTVCNVAATGVANWLRTPYIPTGNSNRIYIDIQFSMRKCTKYPEPGRLQQCKEAFKLLYHESDYDSATSTTPAWNEESYHHIDVVAADRVFTSLNQASINSETRSIPVTRNGIYFVFYDQGACTTLISVRVYYIVCPSVTLNFANFANTTTGLELTSVVQSEGTCVGHAVVEQPPSYLCKGDGNWYFLTGGCHCMPGYEPGDNNTQCVACPPQFYKWQTGNGHCIPCPVNSQASNDGSPECSCKENYYRGSNEDSTLPCTRPPSNVQNLMVTDRDQGTITLQWHQPLDLGGRTDVLYQVECYGCDDSVEYRPHQSHFNSTMVTLSGLNPGTTYTVVIYSLNGVSDTSGLRRMSDITVSTEAAVPPKVKNIRITSVGTDHISIAWSAHRQKMLVEVYEVRYWKDDSVDDSVSNFTSWNNITLQNMLQKTKYSIKVRGRTNKGWGEFSETIHGTTGHIFHYPAENPFGIVVGFAIAVIVCIIFVIILIAIFFKRNNSFCHKKHSSDCEMLNGNRPYPIGVDGTLVTDSRSTIPLFTPPGTLLTYVDPHTYEDPSLAVQEFTKEIDPACIIIESVIGGGEFGDVCKGRLKISGNGELIAAIKTLKSGASDKNRLDFLTEASIMGQFDNPNVIYLEGIVTKSHPIMIVTEYMENGSLDTFLRKNDGKFTSIQLVGMIRGIASGMGYLSEMGYIHRDLAARNILVNENLVCKVSDFGLSREMENDSSGGAYTTKGGKIPIRWTAPEAIAYRKFTTASDVWSYGIVMWEVMSYGERPYWNWTNQDVIKAIDEGYRLTPPMDCPFHIYKLMLNCWQKDRSDRPKFATIVETIDRLIRTPDLLQKLATNKSSKSGDQDDSSQSLNTASQTLGSVADWLAGIKMDRYIETFLNSGYTEMDQVAQITHKDLASLGVSLVGHQKKILNSVQTLKTGIGDSRDTSDATLLS